MTPATLRVNLAERSYDIVVTHGKVADVGSFARQRSRGTLALVVTDTNVQKHAARVADALGRAGFQTRLSVMQPGEQTKGVFVAEKLYDTLLDVQADRRTLVVAVGGGVIGDLAGFVAATYARGLPLLMVPTTLLAMVDSSVGGKVAVNHPRAKNLIGTFHQPIGVWIDLDTLTTLPDREYRSGLAEVVKYGVILDPELFAYLETHAAEILKRQPDAIGHIVARSCQLKAGVVEKDEREETELRSILNYGHTFAHAFEAVAGYGAWLHGEAVAAGMMCAARLAERLGMIPQEVTARQRRLLEQFGLPTAPERWSYGQPPATEPWTPDDLLSVMRSDKKALAGRLRLVLPRRLGEVTLVDDVSEAAVRQVLEELAR